MKAAIISMVERGYSNVEIAGAIDRTVKYIRNLRAEYNKSAMVPKKSIVCRVKPKSGSQAEKAWLYLSKNPAASLGEVEKATGVPTGITCRVRQKYKGTFMETAQSLRIRAQRLEESAQYADSLEAQRADMARAEKLRAEADQLEKVHTLTITNNGSIAMAVQHYSFIDKHEWIGEPTIIQPGGAANVIVSLESPLGIYGVK